MISRYKFRLLKPVFALIAVLFFFSGTAYAFGPPQCTPTQTPQDLNCNNGNACQLDPNVINKTPNYCFKLTDGNWSSKVNLPDSVNDSARVTVSNKATWNSTIQTTSGKPILYLNINRTVTTVPIGNCPYDTIEFMYSAAQNQWQYATGVACVEDKDKKLKP